MWRSAGLLFWLLNLGIWAVNGQIAVIGGSGGGSAPYTACASGCDQTIGVSGSTITAATHGKGANPIMQCWDTSMPRVLLTSQCTLSPTGTVTYTYTSPAVGLIVIGNAGPAGATGATGATGANGADGADGASTIINGTGIDISAVGSQYTVSTSQATTPQYSTGAGAPSGACTAGKDYYLDTTGQAMYFCSATDTWKAVPSATSSAPTFDTYANFVTACTGSVTGEYIPSDSPFRLICASGTPHYLLGSYAATPVPATTWDASGSNTNGTITAGGGIISLSTTATTGTNLSIYGRSQSFGTTWQLDFVMTCQTMETGSQCWGGVISASGGRSIGLEHFQDHPLLAVGGHNGWNTATLSGEQKYDKTMLYSLGGVVRGRIVNDNTNWYYYVSTDGVNYVKLFQETKPAWTPDRVFYALKVQSGAGQLSVLSQKVQ